MEAGRTAPSFALEGLDGTTISLASLLQKGPVLLAFFKVSCPVCQFALPFIERMHAGGGVQMIGVSQDNARATRYFNEEFGLTFPTLLDASEKGYPVSNAFAITHVPSFFLIEPDGTVSRAVRGFSKPDLEAIGERAGAAPFRADENVPAWKAG